MQNSFADMILDLDQAAVQLTKEQTLAGMDRDMQQEALQKVDTYLQSHPATPDLNRAIFMLYHHGAAIDKELSIKTYREYDEGIMDPSREYAEAFLESEMIGKKYLDYYVAFSDQSKFSVIQDQANWHRRVAYFAKYADKKELEKTHFQNALDLHKRLLKEDQSIKVVIDEIIKEHL